MKPRVGYSPPPTPVITRSFTGTGGLVMLYAFALSATVTFQRTLPVFASSAIRCASSVPITTSSPVSVTPRLLMLQHARGYDVFGSGYL